MEGGVNNNSMENENKTENLHIDEKVLDSKSVLSSQSISLERDGIINAQEVIDHVENGCENLSRVDSSNLSQSPLQRTFSPTIIGSAIKAVKSLFSPDKAKKSGTDIVSNPQSTCEENNMKNNLQIDVDAIQSPLSFEHNNTDDSFFTTASRMDDSFQSAITHLDENGEALRSGANVMENILNNSQNLDLMDSYNDTLENNESYLDNTTLKVDNADGNAENLNITQDSGFFNRNLRPDGSNKAEDDLFNENACGFSSNGEQFSKSQKEEGAENGCHSTVKSEILHINGFSENMEIANGNGRYEEMLVPHLEAEDSNEVTTKENIIQLEHVNGEQDDFVKNSISTTTVVLKSNDSFELDNMLASLKICESEGTGSDPCSDEFYSLESTANKLPPNGFAQMQSQPDFSSFSSSTFTATKFSPKLPEKKCLSEGNSPNYGSNLNKIKLNKSEELVNHQVLRKPVEGKRMLQEKKSLVDIVSSRSNEVSEVSLGALSFAEVSESSEELPLETEIGNFSCEQPMNPIASQQSYTILNRDNKLNRPVIESEKVCRDPCAGQTFQGNESEAPFPEGPEKCKTKITVNTSFSTEDLGQSPQHLKQSTPLSNESNLKLFRPTALKLFSPEVNPENIDGDAKDMERMFINLNRETLGDSSNSNKEPLEISPVNSVNDQFANLVDDEALRTQFSAGFEPNTTRVIPSEAQNFSGKSELRNFGNGTGSAAMTHKLNQTFDKNQRDSAGGSPDPTGIHKLNETFKKNSPNSLQQNHSSGHKMNQTFDKNFVSPNSEYLNSTFTKKRESKEGDKGNQTFVKSASPGEQLNKTFDKPLGNDQRNEKANSSFVNKTQILDRALESSACSDKTDIESRQELNGDDPNATYDKQEVTVVAKAALETDAICNVGPGKNVNESFCSGKSSSTSVFSSSSFNDEENQSVDDLSEGKLLRGQVADAGFDAPDLPLSGVNSLNGHDLQAEGKLFKDNDKLRCDPDLVQLIREQFSPNDIEKICNVVQDFSSMKLSNDILKASEQFDKSFHGNISDAEFKPPEAVLKPAEKQQVNSLSPHSFDFLSSIGGKATGRDLSRESLYVKFDPLVQPSANSLIDFTREGEALPVIDASPPNSHNTSICEQLLAISPQKKSDDIVPPLTPLSSKGKTNLNEERLKEMKNEMYFLKNLYAERERANKAKMEEYESQITKLTGESCFLEDKLKESSEREKSLVKKVKEQNQSIAQLKIIMEEYVKVISKLTEELETMKSENKKQIESLSVEKDSYMTHLQNTEAAFTDVHAKYEKSKMTIASLKTNETMFRNTIAEQAQKMEDFKQKAKEAQEKAASELNKIQEELEEMKSSHSQETARLRAQLRKTELKVEALQESLDQKMKENQQLTAICDELIEGKK